MTLRTIIIFLIVFCSFSTISYAQLGVRYKTGIEYNSVSKKSVSLVPYKEKKEKSILQRTITTYESKGYEAFFCKMETKLDKKLKTPIRFRLGSYDYVNQLEGKW